MHSTPAFQWYPKQWLGDDKVLAMEWDARAMHFHLINLAWQQDPPCSIPDDMDAIRRWLGLPIGSVDADQTFRRVRPQIFAAWSLRDDRRWYQPGLVKIWERQVRRSNANTNNVRKRYETAEDEVKESAVVVGLKEHFHELEIIYKAYPRQIAKRAALLAIDKAIGRLVHGECPFELNRDDAIVWLVQRTRLYAKSPAGQSGKYTPHPATWFNRSSYLDDESEWKREERKDSPLSGSEQRVRAARGNIVDALREHVSDRTGRDGGERQDCAAQGVSQGIHARILEGRTTSDSLGVPDLAEDF